MSCIFKQFYETRLFEKYDFTVCTEQPYMLYSYFRSVTNISSSDKQRALVTSETTSKSRIFSKYEEQ